MISSVLRCVHGERRACVREINQLRAKSFHSHPFSANISRSSSSKGILMWCFSWFFMYSITVCLSATDLEAAKYSLAHLSKFGYSPQLFIHRLDSRFMSATSWDSATVGCISTKMCIWLDIPLIRKSRQPFLSMSDHMYLNNSSRRERGMVLARLYVQNTM